MPRLFRAPDGHLVELLHRAVDEQKCPCVVYRLWPDGCGVMVCSAATWWRGFRAVTKPELEVKYCATIRACALVNDILPREAENRG